MSKTLPEVRIAFFGPQGSGKTTLLASYFGNQQSRHFEENHGYRLVAEDTAIGNLLLSRFYRMEKGIFPEGTDEFKEFIFHFMIRNLPKPSLKVICYDYPGKWWETTPKDQEEQQVRHDALESLLKCQVGLLLIDGEKYIAEGIAYTRYLFDQFRNEIRKISDALKSENRPIEEMPQQWLLAISKADCLPVGTTAEIIAKDIVSECIQQLNDLQKLFVSKQFGVHFLLLSSAKGEKGKVLDSKVTTGLEMVAPLALLASLRQVAQSAGKGNLHGVASVLLKGLNGALESIQKIESLLPAKMRILAPLLRGFELREGLEKGAAYFRERQQRAAAKGKSLDAAAMTVQAELVSSAAQICYFCTQQQGEAIV